jgi:hypothetical protein
VINVLCRGPTQYGNLVINRYVATTAPGYGQNRPAGSSVRIIEEEKTYLNTCEEDQSGRIERISACVNGNEAGINACWGNSGIVTYQPEGS